ncbi:hypothetical protein AQUCO_01400356v1 [Aquilegia coerulea]|uniref:Uncharacterized protein n=1 Tax=Aquilegia coerulea TaxID=218851 RepID=A0A2G5DW20_AQUCA|nr:hypothetical protein AQUCO_01400356v1 [Aquilegia coerulea]
MPCKVKGKLQLSKINNSYFSQKDQQWFGISVKRTTLSYLSSSWMLNGIPNLSISYFPWVSLPASSLTSFCYTSLQSLYQIQTTCMTRYETALKRDFHIPQYCTITLKSYKLLPLEYCKI